MSSPRRRSRIAASSRASASSTTASTTRSCSTACARSARSPKAGRRNKGGRSMALANQRVAYINGKILPESEVRISFRDRGYKYGDAVFDMTRTFDRKPFRMKEHIDRFYRSLAYVRIDPGMSPAEMTRLSEEVLERNLHLLEPGGDCWLGQRVSRGIDAVPGEEWESGPTVVIETTPLPFQARARYYRDGIDVVVPPTRRVAPEMLSPRAKTHNYLNMVIGEHE